MPRAVVTDLVSYRVAQPILLGLVIVSVLYKFCFSRVRCVAKFEGLQLHCIFDDPLPVL